MNPASQSKPIPSIARSIPFPPEPEKYKKLLTGAPETVSMRSGYVVLSPGEAVGLHSTGEAEEVVVPLAGTGELRVPGQEPLAVYPGRILYNPPHTPHDVVNTGDDELCYVYIVSRA